jgi:hypothetical protein
MPFYASMLALLYATATAIATWLVLRKLQSLLMRRALKIKHGLVRRGYMLVDTNTPLRTALREGKEVQCLFHCGTRTWKAVAGR